MTLSLGQRISLGICVLVIGLLGALLAISNVWITGAIVDRLAKDLTAADQTVAEVFRLRSQELSVQTRMLAGVPQIRAVIDTPGLDHATVLDAAQDARQMVGSDLLLLVDDRGRLLASATEPHRHGTNEAAAASVATALSGQVFEGMLVTEAGIYQVVGAPIAFADEKVAGALVTGFAVGDQLLSTLEKMTNAHVALWSSSVVQVSMSARPVFGQLAPKLVGTPGAMTTIDIEGGRYLLRVGEIGQTGVSYALARSLDAELGFYKALRTRLLATGAAVLVIALAWGLLYARRVARPIASLAASTARLAAGDLSTRVDVTSRDEVGQLAAAFNRMAGDLEARIEEDRQLAASRVALNAELKHVNEELKRKIEERRLAEEEIKRLNEDLERRVCERTAELEAANRQLESFSYSVSHDLRGPLRRIISFSQIMHEDAAERLTDADRDLLERIRSGALGMDRMIENLLEFSHVGHVKLERRPIDLTAMAHAITEELRASEPRRQVQVQIARDLRTSGDETLVRVALQNLLSNAWKFTARSGQPRIEVGAEAGNGTGPEFYVRDNGAGFDMEEAPKLFRVFERLHSAHDFGGHGIGLATVRRIIEHHGGQIRAEAAPGAGATFRFTLGT
ncbi:MAG TPA: ATP-binding protein [Candidatus Limnocylindrales bacterium]|nr:ATP-binding protein [Candidatus Limnocylindrales bacterium]